MVLSTRCTSCSTATYKQGCINPRIYISESKPCTSETKNAHRQIVTNSNLTATTKSEINHSCHDARQTCCCQQTDTSASETYIDVVCYTPDQLHNSEIHYAYLNVAHLRAWYNWHSLFSSWHSLLSHGHPLTTWASRNYSRIQSLFLTNLLTTVHE